MREMISLPISWVGRSPTYRGGIERRGSSSRKKAAEEFRRMLRVLREAKKGPLPIVPGRVWIAGDEILVLLDDKQQYVEWKFLEASTPKRRRSPHRRR